MTDLNITFGLTTGFIVEWEAADGWREYRHATRAEADEHAEQLRDFGMYGVSVHAEGDLSFRERLGAILEADRDAQ